MAGAEGCVPLHGLSLYIETERHRVLMDFGPSNYTLRNAERLGIDLGEVDVAVLSHGHYDHSGGLLAFAEMNTTAPIYMQRSAAGVNYAYDGQEMGHRYIGIDRRIAAELPQVRLLDGDFKIDDELELFTVKSRRFPLPSTNKRILRRAGREWRGGQQAYYNKVGAGDRKRTTTRGEWLRGGTPSLRTEGWLDILDGAIGVGCGMGKNCACFQVWLYVRIGDGFHF